MAVINYAEPLSNAMDQAGQNRISVAQMIRQTAEKAKADIRQEVDDARKAEASFLLNMPGEYTAAYHKRKLDKFGNDPRKQSEIIADLAAGDQQAQQGFQTALTAAPTVTAPPVDTAGDQDTTSAETTVQALSPQQAGMVPTSKADQYNAELIRKSQADEAHADEAARKSDDANRAKAAEYMFKFATKENVLALNADTTGFLADAQLRMVNGFLPEAERMDIPTYKANLDKLTTAQIANTEARTTDIPLARDTANRAVDERIRSAKAREAHAEEDLKSYNAFKEQSLAQGAVKLAQGWDNVAIARQNADTASRKADKPDAPPKPDIRLFLDKSGHGEGFYKTELSKYITEYNIAVNTLNDKKATGEAKRLALAKKTEMDGKVSGTQKKLARLYDDYAREGKQALSGAAPTTEAPKSGKQFLGGKGSDPWSDFRGIVQRMPASAMKTQLEKASSNKTGDPVAAAAELRKLGYQ